MSTVFSAKWRWTEWNISLNRRALPHAIIYDPELKLSDLLFCLWDAWTAGENVSYCEVVNTGPRLHHVYIFRTRSYCLMPHRYQVQGFGENNDSAFYIFTNADGRAVCRTNNYHMHTAIPHIYQSCLFALSCQSIVNTISNCTSVAFPSKYGIWMDFQSIEVEGLLKCNYHLAYYCAQSS